MDAIAYRGLAAAVVRRAVLDVTGSRPAWKKDAVLWMASRESVKWFDFVDLDQVVVMRRIQWAKHAEKVLQEDTGEKDRKAHMRYRQWYLTDQERRLLRKAMEVLE